MERRLDQRVSCLINSPAFANSKSSKSKPGATRQPAKLAGKAFCVTLSAGQYISFAQMLVSPSTFFRFHLRDKSSIEYQTYKNATQEKLNSGP